MEPAGHTDLKTTQRYMHLSPAMKDSAIRLLEQPIPEAPPRSWKNRGKVVRPQRN